MAPKARGRPRVSKAAAAEALRGVAGAAQRPRPLYEVLGISEGAPALAAGRGRGRGVWSRCALLRATRHGPPDASRLPHHAQGRAFFPIHINLSHLMLGVSCVLMRERRLVNAKRDCATRPREN